MKGRIPVRFGISALTLACILLLLGGAALAAPSGTETRVSFSGSPGCNNILPSADDGWIVWQESCTGDLHIIAYHYRSGIQLTLPNATLTSSAPNIKGRRIVWFEVTDPGAELSDLYYTDLTTSNPRARRLNLPLSWKTNPVVDENLIVWEDKETSSSPVKQDILMYNISSRILYNLTPGTRDSSQIFPSISGNRVVWLDDRNGQYDIFMNTTFDGWALVNVTPGIPGPGQHRPIINGDHIVWSDNMDTIYLNDMSSTTILRPYAAGDRINNVAVCGTYIAWKEQTGGSSGPWDIFVNNIASSAPPDRITDSGSMRYQGVVSDPLSSPVVITPDSRVIWVDKRSGRPNIFMFTFGESQECPVAAFSASPVEGPAPLLVNFADRSTGTPTTWRWEFGDGTTAFTRTALHRYTENGIYEARLIVGNTVCRNASGLQTISVGIPAVNFTGTPTEGIVPLTVTFSGSATGSPTGWLWDFGDGSASTTQNPTHLYAAGGTYDVNLTVTNAIGSTRRSKPHYIAARNGLEQYSLTNISGLAVSGSGPQHLTINTTLIPDYSLTNDDRILIIYPPSRYGWREIVFYSAGGSAFTASQNVVTGIISSVFLTIRDMEPAFSPSVIGRNNSITYAMESGQYSAPAFLLTRVWEGTFPSDDGWFSNIIHKSHFSYRNVGYTIKITRNNLGIPSRLKLNLSAATAWVRRSGGLESGRCQTYVIGMGYNAEGDLVGSVIPAQFTGNDTVHQLEYFVADIPASYTFFTTYALAQLSGNGNPLQLITLTVTQHAGPAEEKEQPAADNRDTEGPAVDTKGAGAITTPLPAPSPLPAPTPDPGVSAKIYTNGDGIVTQLTILRSNDRLATLSVGEGIVAAGADGKPLALVTLKGLSSGSLPADPGSTFTFAGLAYEIGPDGASFNPPAAFALTPLQVQWGHDYIVRTYDENSRLWQDLPTTLNTTTGTITAPVTHLCTIALFSKPSPGPATPFTTAAPMPSDNPQLPVAAVPSSAFSIISGMTEWLVSTLINNPVIAAGIGALALAAYLFRQGRLSGP